jgi:hypothetical protein
VKNGEDHNSSLFGYRTKNSKKWLFPHFEYFEIFSTKWTISVVKVLESMPLPQGERASIVYEYHFHLEILHLLIYLSKTKKTRTGFSRDLYWCSMTIVNNHFDRLLTILQTWFAPNENLASDSWSVSKTEYKSVLWSNMKFIKWRNFYHVRIVWKYLRVYILVIFMTSSGKIDVSWFFCVLFLTI